MKKLMLLTGILAFLLASCGDPIIENPTFWAQDFRNGKDGEFYGVDAELLYEGTRCNVWGEKGSATKEDAKKVADKFDTSIYQKMVNNFGFTDAGIELDGGGIANTTMELADWYGDGDGKLCILLLDIKDDYSASNRTYTAGYFWAGDLMQKDNSEYKYSNEKDMIFIDTNPGLKNDTENTYATLAHEMQHMMSFVTGQMTRNRAFDTWVDEGLSSAAEWVYFNNLTSNGRVKSYTDNRSGLINKGNNFFVWDNHRDNNFALLDDYSTVYLFFQWLRIQADSTTDIYKYIITSEYSDYNAVTDSFSYMKDDNSYLSWPKLLETWLAANRISDPSNIYGYKGQITIKAPYVPANTSSLSLSPGEGVYSKTTAKPDVNSTGNIQYTYLLSSGTGDHSSGADLLTFNKNAIAEGGAEIGTTVASVNVVPEERYVQPLSNELIRIDAGDMMRRNGNWNVSGYPRSNMARRIITNENK